MGMSFAEYLAAAQAAEKSGMSGKDFVKQQRQQQTQKEASQTLNYGSRNTNTYRPPAPPPQKPQTPVVVIPQTQPQVETKTDSGSGTNIVDDGGSGVIDDSGNNSGNNGNSGGGGSTVDPYAEAQKRFDEQIAAMPTRMADQAKAQERAMQLMVSQFQAAQQQAAEAAERQRRQMQIAQAYGQSDPADVRFSRSRAQRAGMVSAGATGAFGRQGLRIRNLNVSAGKNAASNTAGSFA